MWKLRHRSFSTAADNTLSYAKNLLRREGLKQFDIMFEGKNSVSPVPRNLFEDFVFNENLNQVIGSFRGQIRNSLDILHVYDWIFKKVS